MELTIKAYRFNIVKTKLTRVADNVADPKPAFRTVADMLMDIERRIFESQGRRGGGSWKRLSQEWRQRKAQKGMDPRILFASEALFRSMTRRNDPNQILEISSNRMLFGSTLPYAQRIQYGDEKMPARPYLKLTKNDRVLLRNTLRDHVLRDWRRRIA